MGDVGPIDALAFTGHAVRQMFARAISRHEVRLVIDEGETIVHYPDDEPFPSRLLLGFPHGRPLHVVLAYDDVNRLGIVVTCYVPDPTLWEDDFRTRRRE